MTNKPSEIVGHITFTCPASCIEYEQQTVMFDGIPTDRYLNFVTVVTQPGSQKLRFEVTKAELARLRDHIRYRGADRYQVRVVLEAIE